MAFQNFGFPDCIGDDDTVRMPVKPLEMRPVAREGTEVASVRPTKLVVEGSGSWIGPGDRLPFRRRLFRESVANTNACGRS